MRYEALLCCKISQGIYIHCPHVICWAVARCSKHVNGIIESFILRNDDATDGVRRMARTMEGDWRLQVKVKVNFLQASPSTLFPTIISIISV
jgi:hypothetical protein